MYVVAVVANLTTACYLCLRLWLKSDVSHQLFQDVIVIQARRRCRPFRSSGLQKRASPRPTSSRLRPPEAPAGAVAAAAPKRCSRGAGGRRRRSSWSASSRCSSSLSSQSSPSPPPGKFNAHFSPHGTRHAPLPQFPSATLSLFKCLHDKCRI